MASQITHIPYAKKFFDIYLQKEKIDMLDYFVGNIFPDIRYLKTIGREVTHPQNITVNRIKDSSNSFNMGWYTHVYVDLEREKVLSQLGMYKVVNDDPVTIYALKFIEDKITYRLFEGWDKIVTKLDVILKEETKHVSEEVVKRWHSLLINYLKNPPTEDTVLEFINGIGFGEGLTNEVFARVLELEEDREVVSRIELTYNNLFNK